MNKFNFNFVNLKLASFKSKRRSLLESVRMLHVKARLSVAKLITVFSGFICFLKFFVQAMIMIRKNM